MNKMLIKKNNFLSDQISQKKTYKFFLKKREKKNE